MPGPTIDDAFVAKFNRDTHIAYQRTSSMLRTSSNWLGKTLER